MPNITLYPVEDLLPKIERTVARLSAQLAALAPDGEVHHIGATAIAGALTKGDVDMLVRVSAERFQAVVSGLREHFPIRQAANWTAEFASFGNDVAYELPVGIQVVIRDSASDFLLFLRDYLTSDPDALQTYNQLKLAHSREGPEGYWRAKDQFWSRILAGRPR